MNWQSREIHIRVKFHKINNESIYFLRNFSDPASMEMEKGQGISRYPHESRVPTFGIRN